MKKSFLLIGAFVALIAGIYVYVILGVFKSDEEDQITFVGGRANE